jgi:hypothetical protein
LGRWSNLTFIFFRGVGQPPTSHNNHNMFLPDDVILYHQVNQMRCGYGKLQWRPPPIVRNISVRLTCHVNRWIDSTLCHVFFWGVERQKQKNTLNTHGFLWTLLKNQLVFFWYTELTLGATWSKCFSEFFVPDSGGPVLF